MADMVHEFAKPVDRYSVRAFAISYPSPCGAGRGGHEAKRSAGEGRVVEIITCASRSSASPYSTTPTEGRAAASSVLNMLNARIV